MSDLSMSPTLTGWVRRHPVQSSILALGAICLLISFWEGCSCACAALRRRAERGKRIEAARDQLDTLKRLMAQVEQSEGRAFDTRRSLIADTEREVGLAKLRDPSIVKREDFQQIVKRLEEIKASLPPPPPLDALKGDAR